MRGIDLIAAVGAVAEIGDLSRFQNPRERMGYSVALGVRLQRLALVVACEVKALEIAVALVNLAAQPHEEVVEGLWTETRGKALDRLKLAAPFSLEAGEIVLEEDDRRRE